MAGVIGGLPYPTGADKVAEGDNAIQALATAVAKNPAALAANVQTIAPASGWTAIGSGIRYIVINGWVWIYGRAQRATGSNAAVANVPTAAQPVETFRIPATVTGVSIAIGSQITVDTGNTAGALIVAFATAYPANGA